MSNSTTSPNKTSKIPTKGAADEEINAIDVNHSYPSFLKRKKEEVVKKQNIIKIKI